MKDSDFDSIGHRTLKKYYDDKKVDKISLATSRKINNKLADGLRDINNEYEVRLRNSRNEVIKNGL